MSTPDFEMSARGSVPALKARGIEINKKGNAGALLRRVNFMSKSLDLYQIKIRILHKN
jgi:hypothetical protein